METYLNLMLIRFALLAAGAVALALLAFAVALVLKRRGGLDRVRRHVDPLARSALRAAVRRLEEGAGGDRRKGERR
ncbi:hypothetical protein GCM10010302_60070 [Streptomyces polychromogenes]|uniref:Uncharacterized protein n=1 Tax=Streptomyces polychromogenes TaxID=67342 RepID=A0ABP3FAH2_9ACTN